VKTRVIAVAAASALLALGATAQAGPAAVPKSSGAENRTEMLREVAAAKGGLKWIQGKLSHTYETSPVTDTTYVSTIEYVAYKGKKDASRPRVGEVYKGQVWVGRAGDDGAGDEVVTEVILPPNTKFAIKKGNPKRRIRCYFGKANGSYKELTGKACPNKTKPGFHGRRLVPPKGYWDVPTKRWIQVIFPVRSWKRLSGVASSDCLIGPVKNLSGWAVKNWDAPQPSEECPHPDGHGPDVGVFVARKR
jgi:hypothetical protein